MNVYDFADKLLEKISDKPWTLENLEITSTTFDFIRDRLKENNLLPDYDKFHLFKEKKSDELALNHRLRGNEFFKNRKYFSALCAYNESLCFAEAESEMLGLSYANRSAVFLEIQEFNHCRENIELAKQFKYPETNSNKLHTRERLCGESHEIKTDERKTLRLTNKPNPKYPFVADCLELRCSEELGRHIVTERTLKTGEVIAIERPFGSMLLPNCVVKRCTNCLQQNQLNLLPCTSCTSGKIDFISLAFVENLKDEETT